MCETALDLVGAGMSSKGGVQRYLTGQKKVYGVRAETAWDMRCTQQGRSTTYEPFRF